MGIFSLLMPPLAFVILLLAVLLVLQGFKMLSAKPAHPAQALNTSYACGENLASHKIQPDYGQFFPFAFFFTILHVVALMLAMLPEAPRAWWSLDNMLFPGLYLAGAVVALSILYKR